MFFSSCTVISDWTLGILVSGSSVSRSSISRSSGHSNFAHSFKKIFKAFGGHNVYYQWFLLIELIKTDK